MRIIIFPMLAISASRLTYGTVSLARRLMETCQAIPLLNDYLFYNAGIARQARGAKCDIRTLPLGLSAFALLVAR